MVSTERPKLWYGCSRSSKVVDFGVSQKGLWDIGSISHRFWDIMSHSLVQNRQFLMCYSSTVMLYSMSMAWCVSVVCLFFRLPVCHGCIVAKHWFVRENFLREYLALCWGSLRTQFGGGSARWILSNLVWIERGGENVHFSMENWPYIRIGER